MHRKVKKIKRDNKRALKIDMMNEYWDKLEASQTLNWRYIYNVFEYPKTATDT